MTLPLITPPVGTPLFLVEGHGIDEDSVFDQVAFATGHSRARRVWTVTERAVSVRWLLDADELAAVDAWYEDTLAAGSLEFAVQVKDLGPGLRWWRARWISFETQLLHLGRGLVTGTLFLTGEGSESGPETGALTMEVDVALLDDRSNVSVPKVLAMEVLVHLLQPAFLQMEVTVSLAGVYSLRRRTEAGVVRTTEDGAERLVEESP
jgi:hypothetical protein